MQCFTVSLFCKTLCMFQTGFPSIIRNSKMHIQHQAFVRPILLPASSLTSQLLMMDGKTVWNMQSILQGIFFWKVASCWLYSANILVKLGPMNGKLFFVFQHCFHLISVNAVSLFFQLNLAQFLASSFLSSRDFPLKDWNILLGSSHNLLLTNL